MKSLITTTKTNIAMPQDTHNYNQGVADGIRLTLKALKSTIGVFRLPKEAAELEAKLVVEIEFLRQIQDDKTPSNTPLNPPSRGEYSSLDELYQDLEKEVQDA